MFSRFSIKFKITFLSVVTVVGIGMVIGGFAVNKAMKTVEALGIASMESILTTKKNQIEQYAQLLETNLTFFSKDHVTQQMANELIEVHKSLNLQNSENFPIDHSQTQAIYTQYDDHFQNYAKAYGYYDLFVICWEHGHVLYSINKESDLGANLSIGELKNSGLAKVWRKVVKSGKMIMVDMEPYAPSHNEPAMFIGTPILKEGKMVGVATFQISDKALSEIMQQRTGLGKTGETYLVGQDKLMRSDSILHLQTHTLRSSFANHNTGIVNTKAVTEALQGKHGHTMDMNYNNQPVLSVFDTVNFAGVQWIILAEIHQNELYQEAYALRSQIFLIAIFIIIGVILANLWLLKKILISPLQRFQDGLLSFFAYLNRERSTPQRLDVHNQDELGQMSRLVNNNIEIIQKGIAQDNKFIENVADIVSQTRVGELQDRVIATAHNPVLNELRSLLNEVLDLMANVLIEVGNTLDQLANGQLEVRISQHYEGEYAHLQQSCNGIAEQMQSLFSEAETVLSRMANGDMHARISKNFTGDFAGVKASTNAMTEKLQQIIQEVSDILGKLAEGNMIARIQGDFPGDFAEIKRASNAMANDLQAVISETSNALAQLARGDIQVNITGEFAGDFNEIKNAFETTAKKLAEATSQNNIQNWLKTGQSQLSKQMSGDKNILQLAEDIINFLTPYLEAQIGAFYLFQRNETMQTDLKMIASHAYVWRKNSVYEFKMGEGIVGQAALERKTFVITQAPDDYIPIQSGLGKAAPRAILVAPFLYDNALKGVIELASFSTFTEKQLEFLKQVLPAIAIAVNTAESRTKMQELLEQTQAQAEKLQTQQAELQQTNEELQSQTEELQTQAEELQSQQEELRQSNEALEERSRALERQQTAIREKNAELEKTKTAIQIKAEELELASKYKSEFLANMSHELRTPLNSMLILAQMMTDNKNGNLTETQVEYANTIYTSGADLLALINDILDLSKVEAGKIELNPEEVTLANLTTSLEQKYHHLAEDKNLAFIINIADNLPPTLYTDEQRLKQVITNLLSNAFKFTSEGSITLDIQPAGNIDLSRSGLNPAKTIAINVIDTGIGIPSDKQKIIFEAFQQADGTTSRRYGGTGLGLSISRQLIQLLGGEIQLRSEENKGSTFSLYIPERLELSKQSVDSTQVTTTDADETEANLFTRPLENKQADSTVSTQQKSKPVPKDDRDDLQAGDISLLIVEDDRNFSQILMALAKERNFKCLLAEDGRHGLQLAETYKPSAIILDIGLPQIDGWTVMEKLKDNSETRHIPVHFVSGSDSGKDAKQMGAIGYCLKPVSMAELGDAFKNIESFITKTVKNLLIVVDNPHPQQAILDLANEGEIQSTITTTRTEAWQHLQSGQFDCMVLDISIEQDTGFQLLEQLYQEPNLARIPVIIYAERELTAPEETILQKCANNLTVKAVYTPERLLDEVTLFLHQVESKLPQEQQQILRRVRDKEAILAGKKVLIIDDDMRNIFALGASLEEKGMEVIVANNGEEGLKTLEQHSDTAVVLMDIMMPKMDGYEATRRIRALPQFRKLPIIALTAKAMKGDKAKCIEAGANDYLAKPVDTYKLISLLRVWLSQ